MLLIVLIGTLKEDILKRKFNKCKAVECNSIEHKNEKY